MAEGVKNLGETLTTKQIGNQVKEVVEITVEIDGHGPYMLNIPMDDYTPDGVKVHLDDLVNRKRGVQNLFDN